jgi:hypothetical protein
MDGHPRSKRGWWDVYDQVNRWIDDNRLHFYLALWVLGIVVLTINQLRLLGLI